MNVRLRTTLAVCLCTFGALFAGVTPAGAREYARQEPFVVRKVGLPWDGVAYGPHRDGQRPHGPGPSRAELAQDLRLMAKHWHALRVYSSSEVTPQMLEIIRAEKLDLRILLGVWIGGDQDRREIDGAVALAKKYPRIIAGIAVGNETQVFWSAGKLPPERLIAAIREVRARTRVPVTTADDFNFWNKPEAARVEREIDFITTHLHPLWNSAPLDSALDWIQVQFAETKRMHPDRTIVIGETGWATQHGLSGDQGKLMKGAVGEAEQARMIRALHAWLRSTGTPTFVFEAFDENWKGGDDPTDAEKHWGLFHADRSPKLVMREEP